MKGKKHWSLLMAVVMLISIMVPVSVSAEGLPDLVITNVTWTPENPVAGDQVIFKAVLRNQGTGATPDGVIHAVTLFDDWIPLGFDSSHQTSLAPGESVELEVAWTAVGGERSMVAWADDSKRIEESDRDNNYYYFNVTVDEGSGEEEPEPLPDLVLKKLTWTPENPIAGDEVIFKAELENQGGIATPDGVSHSVTIFENWTPLVWNGNHVASMAPGETIELVLPPWTAIAGSHDFMSWVDDAERIIESNEDNNFYSFNLTVGEGSGEDPPEPIEGLDPETLLGNITAEGYFDNAGYNMGTIFIPKVAGKVTAIRVFGVEGETGDHIAYLFDVAAKKEIAGPYTISYNGKNSWIECPLEVPVDVKANKEYMVVVSTGEDSQGHYASINSMFSKAGDNGDSLAWPQNAGRFGTKTSGMPTQSWGSSSYMRDVIFVPTELLPGVVMLNDAGTDAAAVEAALISSALNLNLQIYNLLLDSEKEQVIVAVIEQKPESGYEKRSQIQGILNSIANPIYDGRAGILVKAINEAITTDEIRKVLVSPELELNLLVYNALSYAQKDTVAQAILDGKPDAGYLNADEIENKINEAIRKLLVLPSSQDAPEIHEEFHPWEGAISPDGIWQKAGPWPGTAGNNFEVERAITQETYNNEDGGFLILKSLADSRDGAEIQTLESYGYGYYEVRMKPTDVYGVCNSFFWIESTSGYGPHEWDVEFFTVKDNIVDFTIHPLGRAQTLRPDFDYSADFHRYGFLWTPGRIDYTIDGEVVKSFTHDTLNTNVKGYIMMNSWTEYTWLDGPPATDAEAVYDWVKFYPLNEVDKTSLEDAIKAAKKLNDFNFTAESWQRLQDALNVAIEVDKSIYSAQDQVDTATNDLLTGIDELEEAVFNLPAESMFSDWSNVGSLKSDNWDCNYGIMFSTAVPGKITHIRVFGLEGETGDHVAYIWENESDKIVGGPYTIHYTGSNEWVEYELPRPIDIPQAGKMYTVVVTTGDTGLVPIEREGTAQAGNNGTSVYRPVHAGVFGPKGIARPTVSWRYNYLRDVVFVPYAENPVVVEVNAAIGLAGIQEAIEKYPQWLDLTQYNRLNGNDKASIAHALLNGKSTDFKKVLDIQRIIDKNAEAFVNTETTSAVVQVNKSNNPEQLAQAILSPFLELKLDLYKTLSEKQKIMVLEKVISSRPVEGYASISAIKESLETGIKDLLYNQIPPWNPNFFPIGVWMQNPSPSVMEQYRSTGINTYVSLSSGGFSETLYETLKQYDMKAIVGQNNYARNNMDKAEEVILAWLQQDEPDIAQFTPDWWPLPPIPTEEIQRRYTSFKSYNQTIPVYMNLSQGVANPDWPGRGVDTYYTYMYPEYTKGADILSFDIYCVNGGYDLSYIGKGVDNLYKYSDGKQPVWAFVETTKYDEGNAGRPTPEQVKAQVWIALVHGAKGIEYFCHQFSPFFVEAGPLHEDYKDIKEIMASINAQITELAPVLNSPDTTDFATVESSNSEVTIDFMTKEYEGSKYIFSVGLQADATTATFSIDGEGFIEVLGENRIIEVIDGKFSDEFGPHEVHLYKLRSVAELSSMILEAYDTGQIKNGGILNSLVSKMDKVEKYSHDSYTNKKLHNALNALKNEVKAQSNKNIEAEFAEQLLDVISQFMDMASVK